MASWFPKVLVDSNGTPTQPPLNREQQASEFEARKRMVFSEEPPAPQFPIQPVKEWKLSETEGLKALQAQMTERGIQPTIVQTVEKKIQENVQHQVVNQFYCRHTFQRMNATFFGMPVRSKICSKCGLVK
jgi:hypothetical protein